jgi:DNA repair protein SbcD/Mre11
MIRFIHTADIHFGMENYGKIDPKSGIHSRLLDFWAALEFCVDQALAHRIDFFLFSGDAYKTAHPSQTQQKLLLHSFMRLYKAGIPVVIVIGNHDNPLSFGKAHALDVFGSLPIDGFHVMSKPTVLQLTTKNGPVNIVGIPWPTRNTIAIANKYMHSTATELTRHISQAVVAIINNLAAQLDPHIPAVLAGHLTVANGVFSGSEKRAIYGTDPLFLPSELAIKPFDYVALGHLHRYQNLNADGYPAVVYSGSLERIDFGERNDTKGFCLVHISEKNNATHEFITTPTRPFIQIEVTLQVNQLSFTQQIMQELHTYTLTDAVVKILYHLPVGSTDTVDVKVIQTACAPAHHLVGIFPKREVEIRERRAGFAIRADQDMITLLSLYCDTKATLKPKKELLVKLTQELVNEYEAAKQLKENEQ